MEDGIFLSVHVRARIQESVWTTWRRRAIYLQDVSPTATIPRGPIITSTNTFYWITRAFVAGCLASRDGAEEVLTAAVSKRQHFFHDLDLAPLLDPLVSLSLSTELIDYDRYNCLFNSKSMAQTSFLFLQISTCRWQLCSLDLLFLLTTTFNFALTLLFSFYPSRHLFICFGESYI